MSLLENKIAGVTRAGSGICAALFLASDLSSYVPGIDLAVDGGLTAV